MTVLAPALLIAATTTVFIGSKNSPLSTKVSEYLNANPALKNKVTVVDLDHADKEKNWQTLETLLGRCGISKQLAGIPAVVSEGEGSIECHTSDYPVIDKLRALNGCTALSECVATKKRFASGKWVSDWTKSMPVSDVCTSGSTTETSINLPVTQVGSKKEGLGLVFSAHRDGRAVIEVYQGKLTWILANAETSLTAKSLGLTQRLAGKTSSFIEVSCR